MSLLETFQLSLKNIWGSKMRTFLTMLGIIIGVCAVIVIVGLGNGMQGYIEDSFAELGTDSLTVMIMGRGSSRSVSEEDMYQMVEDNSGILKQLSPTVTISFPLKIGSDTITSSTLTGVSEDYFSIKGYEIAQGRGIQYTDIANREKVCVVGQFINLAYYGGNAVGQKLKVGPNTLTIVGVMAAETDDLEEGGTDDCVFLPYSTASRIGSMGYRDMLLYGTQFEGNSMRGQLGIEVETFEMLEMLQNMEQLDADEVEKLVGEMEREWTYQLPCDREVLMKGARYALALAKKIRERGYDAVTLVDVDGMKKLLGYPPAIVFMLLEKLCCVMTTPENDVLGNATQLMLSYLSGQNIHYMEYYEFFEDSMLIGTPDYIPASATKGEITMLPTAFGLLSASLLNVSKVRDGYVTCARLSYRGGKYYMHLYTAEARQPMAWQEYGWTDPVPQLCSLQVFPDSCTVEEFAQKVSSQHVLLAYGDYTDALTALCGLMGIEVVR